jgi:hypothetical protein
MPYRIARKIMLLIGLASISGCQMQSADDNLPPLRLAPPTIMAPPPVARVEPNTWLPPVSAPIVQPAPIEPPVAAAPASYGGVPVAWVPSVPSNHWTWIIIHHSDSDYGSAAIIDKWHRDRGFDELGYHFVIGNGTKSGDGQIEVGPRWTKQKWGAHDNALDNRYNISGIGICLVGNFNNTHPTEKQMRSVLRLVVYLMRKYNIPADHVLGHGETKDTQCPGRYLHVATIRAEAERMVAETDNAASSQYADQR